MNDTETDVASPSPPSVAPFADGESLKTLAQAARFFFSRPGPRRMATYAATAWAARATLGRFGWADLGACAAVALVWPLQEWLAHKHLLHLEPREGHLDPAFARCHRAHHEQPRDLDRTLLPAEVLDVAMPANVALWLLALGPRRCAATGIAAYATMALTYEWVHFLVHTGYRPKGSYFREVRRSHRLHHHHNENYWLGFTVPIVDRLFGTAPDPSNVPISPTARDLFGEKAKSAAAERGDGKGAHE